MTNEKLFEAIGDLDDAMIGETEGIQERRNGHLGWKMTLIAAVVAGLAITAVATPQIRNALKGGKLETEDTVWLSPTNPIDGTSYEMRHHEIRLDVEFNEDAPESIENYYIPPEIPDEYTQYLGHIMKDGMFTQFGWIVEGTDRDICFYQWAGNSVPSEALVVDITTEPDAVPKHGLRTINGIEGYLVEEPTLGNNYGERKFYWSDGDYLFCLQVPCDFTDAQLEEMVTSVQLVEDIKPYLSTMTEQEIKDIFR
ncbi:MAG: hypothetical protein E7466_01720 [Ruminococcaceae bacterium]|nr:hypothetical protein [Oscillospiraceae bacterium]